MPVVWPSAAVGDRFIVTFLGTMFSQRIMNTFHYRLETLSAPQDTEAAYDDLQTAISGVAEVQGTFLASAPSEYTLSEVWIQRLYTSRVVKKVYAVNNPGTAAGVATASNLAGVITRRGIGANRSNIGSLHVPINNDNATVLNGRLEAGITTLLDSLGSKISVDVTGDGGNIYAPILTGGIGANQFEYITEAFVQPEVRVMRRRTVGLGI